jgi:hypothetical protein
VPVSPVHEIIKVVLWVSAVVVNSPAMPVPVPVAILLVGVVEHELLSVDVHVILEVPPYATKVGVE